MNRPATRPRESSAPWKRGPDGWVGSVQWRRGPGQGTRTGDFPADRVREDDRDLAPPGWTPLTEPSRGEMGRGPSQSSSSPRSALPIARASRAPGCPPIVPRRRLLPRPPRRSPAQRRRCRGRTQARPCAGSRSRLAESAPSAGNRPGRWLPARSARRSRARPRCIPQVREIDRVCLHTYAPGPRCWAPVRASLGARTCPQLVRKRFRTVQHISTSSDA